MTQKSILKKGKARFNLIGEAKISSEYTYKIDEVSKSGWQYNSMNLGINCGNGNLVYADMFGGFSTVKETLLYVNDKDDFMNNYTIDFEDRFTEPILEGINGMNFIKIGIEKDTSGKTFTKKFLSEYDAIAYLREHLEEGMTVSVSGNLEYSIYNDDMQIRKTITSIYLTDTKPEDYRATFTQSILLSENCVGKLDKDTETYPIHANVVDYTKMYNGKEVKTIIPFPMNFELEVNKEKPEATKAILSRLFKVETGNVDEIAVEGKIIEGQQTKELTEDDIPEDMQELIDLGILNKEEVISKMVVNGDRCRRYVITKPYVQMKGEGEERKPVLFIEKGKYKPEDLILDFMYDSIEEEEDEVIDSVDDTSWLDALAD